MEKDYSCSKYSHKCRYFTGYKPCQYKRSCINCPHEDAGGERILVISLEALGAVLRSTCLLPAIKRQFPHSHITWVTYQSASALLKENPLIDRLLFLDKTNFALLSRLKFSLAICVDKSMEAGAVIEEITATKKVGFGLTEEGTIRPLNREAEELYDLGLDDNLKFNVNKKSENQLMTEAMGLPWKRDPYVMHLAKHEHDTVQKRRSELLAQSNGISKGIIGYNTGCSTLYPYKKLTVQGAVSLITMWRKRFPEHTVVLLGGREDTDRQRHMKEAFINDDMVVNSPTDEGLRSGLMWTAAVDMLFSGCSLGMHMGIALKKPIIAWFGVSCIQEVDLYDKGVKIQSPVTCSPCWKKTCEQEAKCFEQLDERVIGNATADILSKMGTI